jgi:hypothetical protein
MHDSLVGKSEGTKQSRHRRGLYIKIALKAILECENVDSGFLWFMTEPTDGPYGHGNKIFGSIIEGCFLD